jgi:hypothetical protein
MREEEKKFYDIKYWWQYYITFFFVWQSKLEHLSLEKIPALSNICEQPLCQP